jgi:hypothetical protein
VRRDERVRPAQHAVGMMHNHPQRVAVRNGRSLSAMRHMGAEAIVQEGPADGETMMMNQASSEVQMEADSMILPDGATYEPAVGCEDGSCGDCGNCFDCCFIPFPCPRINWDNFEFFAGAQGVTGPTTAGEGGSFGFHEGVNWGRELRLPCRTDCHEGWLSGQLGFRATQMNFAGSDITSEDRRQAFVTGGLFRRADWGLQGGAVVDFLHDEWYYDRIELAQLRGEVSWVFPTKDELGFWMTHGMTTSSTVATTQETPGVIVRQMQGWEPVDLYAFFYRRQFEDCNASGRVFAGFTGESDGLIGTDFNVPLSDSWALRGGFTYLVPNEGKSTGGNIEESWNVGISLVWYPGCRTARTPDYHRPLFDVADNGSFMVHRD